MRKTYKGYFTLCAAGILLSMFIASCKKEHTAPVVVIPPKPLATLGLYEVDSGIYKRVFIPITKVGTQTGTYFSVFDTGSAGMTIDATGLVPASMITASGFNITGDSINVNGITIMNQPAVISYGNAVSEISEYGNLAYAPVTIGDANGAVTATRIPMFLYYKIVDNTTNQKQPAHSNDVFGVGPGLSFASSQIGSPLSYFKLGAGVTNGFKLETFGNAYSLGGTYVNSLLTIGLVPDDLASTSGFKMHQLIYYNQGGYSPDIPATVTYSGKSVAATLLFDTGTPAISTIEDSGAASKIASLPANTNVTFTTNSGFTYSYTTAGADNLTQVAKPSYTGDPRTIFSIDFFSDNEFLIDYTNHRIGLKNN
jgi:hypothetical protein